MEKLAGVIKNESIKLLSQKKYLALIIFTIGLVLLGGILSGASLNYSYNVLTIFCYLFIPISVFMCASDLISGEREHGVLRISFLHPVSRNIILIGKLVTIICYNFVAVFALTLFSAVISLVLSGSIAVNLFSLFSGIFVTLIPIIAFSSIAVFIACNFKTATGSFAAGLIFYISIIASGFLFSNIEMILPTSYLTLYRNFIGTTILWSNFLMGFTILGGFSLIFVSLASMKFVKVEV